MVGSVVIAPNRRQRSNTPLNVTPTRTNLAAIVAAETLAHDLYAAGFPADLASQNALLVDLCDPLVFERSAELDRRGVAFLEAAARFLVTHHHHASLRFLPQRELLNLWNERVDQTSANDVGERSSKVDEAAALPALARRRRVLWAHTEGPAVGLLVDRIHHTPRSGIIEVDTWIRRKVAQDLRNIANLQAVLSDEPTGTHDEATKDGMSGGEHGVLGVRVFSHRAPNAGVHFTAAINHIGQPVVEGHHRIGGCDACRSSTHTDAGVSLTDEAPGLAAGSRTEEAS